jgi:hypothetical protein
VRGNKLNSTRNCQQEYSMACFHCDKICNVYKKRGIHFSDLITEHEKNEVRVLSVFKPYITYCTIMGSIQEFGITSLIESHHGKGCFKSCSFNNHLI